MNTTGMERNSSLRLSERHSSNPSIHDIITSSRMMSGRSTWSVLIRRRPFDATLTSYPACPRRSPRSSRTSRSSSTTATLRATSTLGLERHQPLPLGAADEQLDPLVRRVEDRMPPARQRHPLLERLQGFLQREVSLLQLVHHRLQTIEDLIECVVRHEQTIGRKSEKG